jgi:hypothetical protein
LGNRIVAKVDEQQRRRWLHTTPTVNHFRKALRGEVLKWYNDLPLLDMDNLNLEVVKTQFEQNFKAALAVSSLI